MHAADDSVSGFMEGSGRVEDAEYNDYDVGDDHDDADDECAGDNDDHGDGFDGT